MLDWKVCYGLQSLFFDLCRTEKSAMDCKVYFPIFVWSWIYLQGGQKKCKLLLFFLQGKLLNESHLIPKVWSRLQSLKWTEKSGQDCKVWYGLKCLIEAAKKIYCWCSCVRVRCTHVFDYTGRIHLLSTQNILYMGLVNYKKINRQTKYFRMHTLSNRQPVCRSQRQPMRQCWLSKLRHLSKRSAHKITVKTTKEHVTQITALQT